MSLFVDTSALLAALDPGEEEHGRVAATWREALTSEVPLETTSYVVVESVTVAQRKLGLDAVGALETGFWPLMTIHWIGAELHRAATSALLAAGRRRLSLVDCASFEVMRRRGLDTALALDRHFEQHGFSTLP